MVAPDCHLFKIGGILAQLLGQLGKAAVVVQTHHGVETFRRNVLGVSLGNQGVGVGWVAHHKHANIVGRMIVEGRALGAKDLAVGGEQVRALLTLATWLGANQEGGVGTVKCLVSIVGDGDLLDQWERGIQQFHGHTLCRTKRGGDFQKIQLDRSVLPVHITVGDAPQQGVGDLAGSSSHSNLFRGGSHSRDNPYFLANTGRETAHYPRKFEHAVTHCFLH